MPDGRVFTAFNFKVEIRVPGVSEVLCEAHFAECDGLEMTMETKSFQQGGVNTGQMHLAGPVTHGQLTLKRGMSADLGLWKWFAAVMKSEGRGLRGQATVVMLGADRSRQLTFTLTGCLPVKMRAPALNAKEGLMAIEEMQVVYSTLDVSYTPGLPENA